MAVLDVLCYRGVRWMRIWVSEVLPRVPCPQPSSIVMPCRAFGSISQHPSFSLWLLPKHCVILSQAENYSFIFPSTFFLKVNGCLLLLFVFYSCFMADLFPKLQSSYSFPHRQMSWNPSSPGSRGLCHQLATGLLFLDSLLPIRSHLRSSSLLGKCAGNTVLAPVCLKCLYSTCTLGWWLKLVFLSEFWICLFIVCKFPVSCWQADHDLLWFACPVPAW